MIPEEDRPASWLRGYGGIEADIRQLREFADKLQAEVERNYAPHLSYIAEDMTAPVPNPADAFIELVNFLQHTTRPSRPPPTWCWGVRDATGHLAGAAGTVATRYTGSDAFASARVTDVERALPTRPPQPLAARRRCCTTPPARSRCRGAEAGPGAAVIERGSGRTSGLTDWRLMDVASMWACLQDHDTTNTGSRSPAGARSVTSPGPT